MWSTSLFALRAACRMFCFHMHASGSGRCTLSESGQKRLHECVLLLQLAVNRSRIRKSSWRPPHVTSRQKLGSTTSLQHKANISLYPPASCLVSCYLEYSYKQVQTSLSMRNSAVSVSSCAHNKFNLYYCDVITDVNKGTHVFFFFANCKHCDDWC